MSENCGVSVGRLIYILNLSYIKLLCRISLMEMFSSKTHVFVPPTAHAGGASIVSVTDRLTDLDLAHDERSFGREKNNSPPYTTLFQLGCSVCIVAALCHLLFTSECPPSAVCSRLGVFSPHSCVREHSHKGTQKLIRHKLTVCKQFNKVFIRMSVTFTGA